MVLTCASTEREHLKIPRSLRFWLSVGLSTLVALAGLLVTAVVFGVLIPRLNAEVEVQNRALSTAAATQINNFLADFSSQLNRLGSDISSPDRLGDTQIRSMLDSVTNAEKGIESIYVINDEDRVIEVGLDVESRPLRENQLGIDFSGRNFARMARLTRKAVWSDTYLSARGNIVVALAIPLDIPGKLPGTPDVRGIMVGELDLQEVSRFAALLSNPQEVLTVIVDHRGNVIGHPDAERALRQENLRHLAPLDDERGSSRIEKFRLDSIDYLGSTAPIPEAGWTAMVGQQTVKAFAIVRLTLASLAVSSAIALLMAVIAALAASRRIMRHAGLFAAQMEAVANGHYLAKIAHSGIDKIDMLSRQMEGMAAAVLEREARLRESETNFRTLVESAPQGIALIGKDGQFLLVNAAYTRLFGYALSDIQGMPAWWASVCPAADARETAIRKLDVQLKQAKANSDELRLFRLLCADGEPRDIELVAARLPDQRILITFSDVTERKLNEVRLQRASKVFSHAREGILITDALGTVVEANETFTRITDFSREDVIGQNLSMLGAAAQSEESYATLWQSLVQNSYWHGEISIKNRSGASYPALTNITAISDASGATQNYVALFTDITQLKEYQRQLEHVAHFDPLTGLPNRVLLGDRLQQAMSQSQRRDYSLAVLYLDLDGFKAVNDHYGHDMGDRLLVVIAQRMKESLREGDTISRIGGDEFVAVLVDLENEQDYLPILERLTLAAASPVNLGSATLHVSASIGVTFYPRDRSDADLLLRHADQAMYQAKQAGKNRYCVFDVALDAATANQLKEIEQVSAALARNEFVLYYQPKVNMQSGVVTGVEALIRWQHPERGLLPPAAFLPVIEGHPISVELGDWVIDTALAQIGTWRAIGLDMPVSVNVGACQLLSARFDQRLAVLLAAHPTVPADRLELEILETSALDDVAKVSELMTACLELGVSFSLDDFGTGYSSLNYLKRLPAGVLKIDRDFVEGMLEDQDDLAIVQGIIGLAAAFRRQVIAEGVETVAHGTQLLALGCVLVQGYGIARPMPASDLPDWVATWKLYPEWSSAVQRRLASSRWKDRSGTASLPVSVRSICWS